jgi:hypothetical protein
MAEDITNLDITENYTTGPDPIGPKPFNKQNLFDLLKNPTTKRVDLPSGKVLKAINTPDELNTYLQSEDNLKSLWASEASKLTKNFPISSINDLRSKRDGLMSGQEKVGLQLNPIQKTPIMPKFGDAGFETAAKNDQAYIKTQQDSDKDAIDAFSKFYANGLSVTADGKEITNYQGLRDYFSNQDNVEKWQQNFDIQKKLKSTNNFDLFTEIKKLSPKETITSALTSKQIVSDIKDKAFFGNLNDEEIGEMLDQQNSDPSSFGKDLNLGEAGNYEYMQTVTDPNRDLDFEFVPQKESKLNKNTFRDYYRSKNYSEDQIDNLEYELRSKARDKKFYDADQKFNEGSQNYNPQGDYWFGELSQSLGVKTQYQASMNKKGYELLSLEDRAIANSLEKLDKLKRELDAFGKSIPDNPAWFMTAKGNEYITKKEEYDVLLKQQQQLREKSGYSGINVYDPETRTALPAQQVAQIVAIAKEKKPKDYYTKSLLGTLIRDRNALMLNVEDLDRSLSKFSYEQTKTPEYQKTKLLYYDKMGELIAVNKAIYTNDSPFKRKDTGFLSGVKAGILTADDKVLSSKITRSALAGSWYRYAQNAGIPIEDKDLESIEEELAPKFWEGFGETTWGTLAVAAEAIAYAAVGNAVGAEITAAKWFTKLKEFSKLKYGTKNGEFITGLFEKGLKFGVRAGSQIGAGQSVASYTTEEALEGGFESVAGRFTGLMKSKYTMFLSKWLMGSVGSGIGEFFGNLADAEAEEGRDIRQLFKDVYGETWETQEKQLAYIGLMSVGFAGAGNFDALLQTKQAFVKYKASLGGKFTDPLLSRVEMIIDEAVESNTSVKQTAKKPAVTPEKKENVQATASEQVKVEEKQKASVENRVADVNEEFHIVENDGQINKDVSYRYNKQTGNLETKGYTEFNRDWAEANNVLSDAVKIKQQENGIISRDKFTEIAKKELGIADDETLTFENGKILYQRDPEKIAKDNRQRVSSVKTARKSSFDEPLKRRREKIKQKQFSDIKDIDAINTPEFSNFFNRFKDAFGASIRINMASVMYNGAKIVDSASRGLAKISDYTAPIMQKYTETTQGREKFDAFVSFIVGSKRFQESEIANDQEATEYAKTLAINLLINEEGIVNDFFDENPDAMVAFRNLSDGFIRHSAKKHTGREAMRFNSSFFSSPFDETSKRLTDADLDVSEKQLGVVLEERRKISATLERAGVESSMPVVESIRYRDSQKSGGVEFSPENFLNNIGEDTQGMTPDQIKTLADQKADELYDMDNYENHVAVLSSFKANEKNVKNRIKKELKTKFDLFNKKTVAGSADNPLNGAQSIIYNNPVVKAYRTSAQRKAVAELSYRILESMAIRSGTTPESILNDTLSFEKVQKDQIANFMAQNQDTDILFDSIIGVEGAARIPEIMHNYEAAKAALDNGTDPKRVFAMYGWYVDPAGQLKYALTPFSMKLKNSQSTSGKFTFVDSYSDMYREDSIDRYTLSDIVDYPELFQMYPDLQNISITILNIPSDQTLGSFSQYGKYDVNNSTDGVKFNSAIIPGKIFLNMAHLTSPEAILSTLKHEIQHAVQFLENTQEGYSPESANNLVFTKEGFDDFLSSTIEKYKLEGIDYIPQVKEAIDLLSSSGADKNINYRGAVYLFMAMQHKVNTLRDIKRLSGTKLLEAVKMNISNELYNSFNDQKSEESIEKVANILLNIPNKGTDRFFTAALSESISNYQIYGDMYGEYEAREVQQPRSSVTFRKLLRSVTDKDLNSGNKELIDSIQKEIEGLFEEGKDYFKTVKVLLNRLYNSEDANTILAFKNDIKKVIDNLDNNKNLEIGAEALILPTILPEAMTLSVETEAIIEEILEGQFVIHQKINKALKSLYDVLEEKPSLTDPFSSDVDFLLLRDAQNKVYKSGNASALMLPSSEKIDFNSLSKKLNAYRKEYKEALDNDTFKNSSNIANLTLFDEFLYALFQQNEGVARAAVVFKDTQAIIYALTDPTVASPVHEMVHVYEKYLTDTEKENIISAAGQTEWNTEVSEYFARGFEKYLADGVAPSTSLSSLFKKFKEWMLSIYGDLVGGPLDVALTPKIRDIYATMLGETTLKDELIEEENQPLTFSEKDMLGSFIDQMRAQGKSDSDIYRGLIEENGFTPSDVSEFFSLTAKKTVQTELEQLGTFKEEAASISDEIKYNTERNAQELTIELQRINEEEARGILYAFRQLPTLDVAVSKVIIDMLEKKANGQSVIADFALLAETGTNLGRALQRFKMIKQNQASYTLSALVKDLTSKSRQIPKQELKKLDIEAKIVDKLTKEYENAKRQAEKYDLLNNESPLRPGMSNLDYFKYTQKRLIDARATFAKNIKPWSRKSSFTDLWSTLIRGSLLTPTSLIINITASAVKTAVQGFSNTISTTISSFRSLLNNQKKTTFKDVQYYKYGLSSLKNQAMSQAKQQLVYGHSTDASSRFEIERGFNGFKALAEYVGMAFNSRTMSQNDLAAKYKFALGEDGKIKNKDKVLRFIEGTLGLPSEFMFRMLGAPDAIFKNTAYFSALYQEARRQGYNDKKQIEWFIALHSDYSNDKAYNDSLKFIYSNNSELYKKVSGFTYGSFKEDTPLNKAMKLLMTTEAPYQKIPINVAIEYFDFMVPIFGIGRAGYNYGQIANLSGKLKTSSQKNKKQIENEISLLHQEAEEHLGRAIAGTTLIWAANMAIAAGAVSGSSSDKREREKKQIFWEPNSLNITLLLENLGFSQPQTRTNETGWIKGDNIISLTPLGVFGGILGMLANKRESKARDIKEIQTVGNIKQEEDTSAVSDIFEFGSAFSYLLDQSFVKNFGNTISLFQNLGDSEEFAKTGSRTVTDLIMTGISPVSPGTLASIAKIDRLYKPEMMSDADWFLGKLKEDLVSKFFSRYPGGISENDPIKRDVFGNPMPQTPEGRNAMFYNLFDVSKLRTDRGTAMTFDDLIKGVAKPSWESLVGIALQMGAPDRVMPQSPPRVIKDVFKELNYQLPMDLRETYHQKYYTNERLIVNTAIDALYGNSKLVELLDPNGQYSNVYRNNAKLGLDILADVMSSLYAKSAELTRNQLVFGMIPEIENRLKTEDPEQYKLLQDYKNRSIYAEGYQKLSENKDIIKYSKDIMEEVSKELDRIKELGYYQEGTIQKMLGVTEDQK